MTRLLVTFSILIAGSQALAQGEILSRTGESHQEFIGDYGDGAAYDAKVKAKQEELIELLYAQCGEGRKLDLINISENSFRMRPDEVNDPYQRTKIRVVVSVKAHWVYIK